jgi:hypothetical protein
MGCSETRDSHPGLGKGYGISGVSVDDRADTSERLEESPVGWSIRRRAKRAINGLAIKINHDYVTLGQRRVVYAARLNGKDRTIMIRDTDISKSEIY